MSKPSGRRHDAIDRLDLEPWQREVVDAVMARRPVTQLVNKRSARHRLAVLFGAIYELEGRRWDAYGSESEARDLRRQARELAAHLDCPCGVSDA